METAGLGVRARIEDLPVGETWPRHEIIDGTLIVTPLAGVPHQGIVSRMTIALGIACPAGLVVSPSSRTTDTVTKPATYAEWGVPAYLAVTPVPGGRASLTWHGDVSAITWAVKALEAAVL